jgi:arylsulfatase A
MFQSIRLSLIVVIGLLCSAVAVAAPPNIILINVDDLGINDLHCYGRAEHHTPHLDRMAKEGLRFTSGYCAQPICSASRAALMTGKAPARLHLTTFLPGRRDLSSQKLLHPVIEQALPLAEVTLAEHLQALGYTTGIIGKWHLGGDANFGPAKQGFDSVVALPANTKPSETEGGKGEYATTQTAVEFIEKNSSKSFFLYLAHNTPHIPIAGKAELIKKYQDTFNPTYAAVMHSMDECIGQILETLVKQKIDEQTLVIFISDNGGLHVPELDLKTTPPTHNTPFRAGKGYVYEGGLRVPLIVRWPKKISPRVIDTPVINTDLLPTLVELAGGKVPEKLDGVSQAAAFLGQKEFAARRLFWHFPHYTNQGGQPAGAVRDGQWKLVVDYGSQRNELYDLQNDIGEQVNLAAKYPERIKELTEALIAWRKSINAQENTPNPNFDAAQFKAIYEEHDSTMLKPAKTAVETANQWQGWYQAISRAANQGKPNKKANQK